MARSVQVEVYLPPELLTQLDDAVENRSAYVRGLIEDDLGVRADATE